MSGLGIDWSLVAGVIVFAAIVIPRRVWRRIWRFGRRGLRKPRRRHAQRAWRARSVRIYRSGGPKPDASSLPFVLSRFWVVDGDTIQDNTTKTIYRLENIDCPETDDRAKCHRERKMGDRAKFEAIRLLKGATIILVRPAGRIDPYGRSIAAIDVDGQDFGELMIARGFARPWRGVREDWCGPNGGLARMAEACSAQLHCKTCGARAGVVTPSSAMNFPAVYRKPPDMPEEPRNTPSDPKAPEVPE